jgi:periplasmic protein TonB
MSLSQKYRLKFAAHRGDRLVLCVAAAVVFHLGLITIGMALWQNWAPKTAETQPDETVPIEFVYLDQPERKPAAETKRQAAIDAAAGGVRKPDLPTDAGKPELTEELTAQINPAKPSTASVAAPQTTGAIVPASNQKAAPQTEPQAASQTGDKPTAAPATPAPAVPAVPEPLPSLAAADPTLSAIPASSDESPEIQVEVAPSPTAPAGESPTPTPTPSIGTGLDGLTNPNRTASAETGLDAERHPILGDYLAQLNREIYQDWQQIPNIDATRETKVRLTVNQLGELVEISVAQSSGSDMADQIAMTAVRNAAPFAPLPPTWEDPLLVVNITLIHQLHR